MIYLIGITAIISMLAFLVHLFIKAYNQDQKEQDERIQVLEKRIEEYKKDIEDGRKKDNIKIYENLTMNNQDIGRITKEINKIKNKRENEKK